ncbi:MAG: serine/threonine protein kinase [Myxococcales bacterium]|nr:serine/threonine protein kinase [Myxococcales bacterium]
MSTTIGRYQVLQKLAQGGMAEIFLATADDAHLQNPTVVIKRILPELSADQRYLAMFLNEAQLAAQMRHPNIVRVFEFGEDNGLLFMVMEFVDGLDCWRLLRRLENTIEDIVPIAVHIVRRVLDALEYAHNMKDVNGRPLHVVHRDLSPSNIYVSRQGTVKLGDFGIARVDSSRFRPIEIIPKGKYGYMAPEQVEGKTVDRRADVYSAGVVLSELLIRQQLFTGTNQLSVMLDIRDGRIEKLEKNAERIPPRLLDLLKIALARDPAQRFRSAADFSLALRAFETGASLSIEQETLSRLVTKATAASSSESAMTRLGAMGKELAGRDLAGTLHHTQPDGITNSMSIAPRDDLDETPITLELEHYRSTGRYWAQLPDGRTLGPTTFAHIIELVYSGRIQADTPLSVDGRIFQPTEQFEELHRHLPGTETRHSLQASAAQQPKRRGILELESPLQLLLAMAAAKDTGLLICHSDGQRKDIYVRDGMSVYVSSNDPSELLGEYLVANNIIERAELDMVLALLPKFHGHLGDTLIALGLLTAVDVLEHITNQVRARLKNLLLWRSGEYEFYADISVRSGIVEVPTDLFTFARDALLAHLHTLDGTEVIEKLEEYHISPAPIRASLIAPLALPSEFEYIIGTLQERTTVAELVRTSGAVPLYLGKAIYAAIETGLWRYEGPTPYWRVPESPNADQSD